MNNNINKLIHFSEKWTENSIITTNKSLYSDFLFKILLLGDSGVGKSCIILRYIENSFSQNLMNSIGVDFKLKNIDVDGKKVKLQIVIIPIIFSGTQQGRNGSERSQPHTTKAHRPLLWYMTSLIETPSSMSKIGWPMWTNLPKRVC